MNWILAGIAACILGFRAYLLWSTRDQRTWRWWVGWAVPAFAGVVMLAELGSLIEIKKFIGHLLMPAGLVWVGLAGATAWSALRRQRGLGILCSGVFVLYSLAGNAWIGGVLIRSLERHTPPVDVAALADHGPDQFDAICVLGGGTDRAPDGRAEASVGGDRVVMAAQLFIAGKTRSLVSSGSTIDGMETKRDLAEETAAIWRGLGVPGEAIVTLPGPRVTSEEITAYRHERDENHWAKIGLVTSAWHMPRALRQCRRAGLEVVPIPCDFRGNVPGWSLVWLVPQERGFQRVQLAMWEYLGMLSGS